jgi:hypothetical protein
MFHRYRVTSVVTFATIAALGLLVLFLQVRARVDAERDEERAGIASARDPRDVGAERGRSSLVLSVVLPVRLQRERMSRGGCPSLSSRSRQVAAAPSSST